MNNPINAPTVRYGIAGYALSSAVKSKNASAAVTKANTMK